VKIEFIVDRSATVTNEIIIKYKYIILRAVWYGYETCVSDVKGGTQTEDVWEQVAGGSIWTEQGSSDRRFEKTA
jgi:hypothetical protein